ncbi:MAG: extracellular solute-binding protein [Lautropia sp.]|nr:extracellular solute-binding protein [Lautropia sp.]
MRSLSSILPVVAPDPAGRRALLRAGAALPLALAAGLPPGLAQAAAGMAWGGQPRYPEGFTHFDYVRPDAPRGGLVRLAGYGSFDTLNPFALRGISAAGLGTLMFETLVVRSWDEPFSVYGLLAEDMVLADDRLSVMFKLRAEARFSNGDPVLAEDVRHSFERLVGPGANPVYRQYFGDVERVEVLDERIVRFIFRQPNGELHLILAEGLPVFSRRWGEGRELDAISQQPPVTSGPYRIDSIDFGKQIAYRRRDDYWAEQLPVRRGMFNFNRVLYKYFKDETARLEGFKAGEFDWLYENSARNWARGHVGARYRSGELLKRSFPDSSIASTQGFVLNQRRALFRDVRVRHALALAFDFDWLNRQVFYGQYTRTRSYFSNSTMAATGVPDVDESAFLQSLRTPLDEALFGPVPELPASPDAASLRNNLRQAQKLLTLAGWQVGPDGVLRNAAGTAFSFELLNYSTTFERIASPWIHNLARLGIRVRQRVVDPALYVQRMQDFNFDVTVSGYAMSSNPGNELHFMLASASARQPGSQNYAGIADPLVDEIIERVVRAQTRPQLELAARVLDRVLRHGWYLVPQFHSSSFRVAFDYRLRHPAVLPLYYSPDAWLLQTWWFDAEAKPVPLAEDRS